MRGRSLSILGIVVAVVGAVLVLCFSTLKVAAITIACGVIFLGVGLVNLLFYSSIQRGESAVGRVLTLVANAAAIVLGVSMLVFKDTFVPLISFMFGLLVAVCALWQFFVLSVGTRPYQLPAWLYLFPILIAGGAAYIFIECQARDTDHLLMLATGGALALLGVGCVIEGSILGAARRASRHKEAAAEGAGTPDDPAAPPADTPASPAAEAPRKRPVETTDDLDDVIEE